MNTIQAIKLINIGRAKLGWDEDLYRSALLVHGGTPDASGRVSLKSLSLAQMAALLAHMRRCGFAPTPQPRQPHNLNVPSRAMLTKIEALLAEAGKDWRYAEGIIRRITRGKKQRLEFCTNQEMAAVIGALERNARVAAKASQ